MSFDLSSCLLRLLPATCPETTCTDWLLHKDLDSNLQYSPPGNKGKYDRPCKITNWLQPRNSRPTDPFGCCGALQRKWQHSSTGSKRLCCAKNATSCLFAFWGTLATFTWVEFQMLSKAFVCWKKKLNCQWISRLLSTRPAASLSTMETKSCGDSAMLRWVKNNAF